MDLAQLAVLSAVHGSIYALVAAGLVLIFRATDIINFAQGQVVMLGAYVSVTLQHWLHLPYALNIAVTMLIMAAVGVVIDLVACRRLLAASPMNTIIATFAVGIILENGAILLWGPEIQSMASAFGTTTLRLGLLRIAPQGVWIVVVTTVVLLGLFLFLRHTLLGTALEATAQNRTAAQLIGISLRRVFSLTWAISAALGGLAGHLIAPVLMVEPAMGWIAIKAFTAAIVAGFNLPGTIAAGYLVSFLENVSGFYFSVALKDATAFVLIIVVLLLRPSGLFARHRIEPV